MRCHEIAKDGMTQSNWGLLGEDINYSLKNALDFNKQKRKQRKYNSGIGKCVYKTQGHEIQMQVEKR